jgi:hypothetical protein
MNKPDELEKLKYPIGRFIFPERAENWEVQGWIDQIESLPAQLIHVVSGLSGADLAASYRQGGWTVRQVIHHIADSHLNSYVRFKWTLTEDKPTIKAYDQDRWAELPDNDIFPVEDSLEFIRLLHKRWVNLLRSLDDDQLNLEFHHPELGKVALKNNFALYAWHGEHHLAHVSNVGRY